MEVDNRLERWQRWLAPAACLLCLDRAAHGRDLCLACEQSLPWLQGGCIVCGAPGVSPIHTPVTCGTCQQTPPVFAATTAVFRYAPPLDRLILDLKYHGRLEYSRVLGSFLADHLRARNELSTDVIIPVPLHVSRLRERGYNQSLELARVVAQKLSVPLDGYGVRRARATAPQTDLTREARRKNVRGAFATRLDYSNQRIAIIDDVMTSGHTANALAECLRRSGAREVRVWVVARA